MNIDDLTIGEVKSLAAMIGENQSVVGDGRAVIVRSRDQGVMYGKFAGYEGSTVHLKDAVQMWRWNAAKGGTLADCAQYGVNIAKCKFSHAKVSVTIFGACAIIDCTPKASKSIEDVDGGDWS